MMVRIDSWKLSDDPSRDACDKCPGRDVLRDYCACGDDTAFAEAHAFEHHRTSAHPHLVLDVNRTSGNVGPVFVSRHPVRNVATALSEIQRMRVVINDQGAESDEHVITDDDFYCCV